MPKGMANCCKSRRIQPAKQMQRIRTSAGILQPRKHAFSSFVATNGDISRWQKLAAQTNSERSYCSATLCICVCMGRRHATTGVQQRVTACPCFTAIVIGAQGTRCALKLPCGVRCVCGGQHVAHDCTGSCKRPCSVPICAQRPKTLPHDAAGAKCSALRHAQRLLFSRRSG